MFGYPGGPVSLLELLLAVASGGTPDQYDLPLGFRDGVQTAGTTGQNAAQWNRLLFPMWAGASIYFPEKGKKTQMISGAPADAAKELVKRLREDARAL